MKEVPVVAVLLSSYNGEKYITDQIESILSQENVRVILCIRDDGSTDRTIEILNAYKDKGSIIWYTGANLKPAKSFYDLLINAPRADYYAFSDQDDIWDNNKLCVAVNVIQREKCPALYFSNARLVDQNNCSLNEYAYKKKSSEVIEMNNLLSILVTGGGMGCTMVLNRYLFEIARSQGVPEKIIMHDYYIMSLCKSIGGNVFFDGKAHMNYRQHGSNVIGRKKGICNAVKYRLNFLFEKKKVSMADQAEDILVRFSPYIKKEINVLKTVAEYNQSFRNRLKLCLSRELKLNTLKDSLFIRMTILLGRR